MMMHKFFSDLKQFFSNGISKFYGALLQNMMKTFLMVSIIFIEEFMAINCSSFKQYFGVKNDQVYNYVRMCFAK